MTLRRWRFDRDGGGSPSYFVGLDLEQSQDYSSIAVVERVRTVVQRGAVADRCTLVKDATGVGAAVLDLLRGADLGCGIMPVILTAGGRKRYDAGAWRVPKRDLITDLRVILERGELKLSRRVAGADALARELGSMARGHRAAGG